MVHKKVKSSIVKDKDKDEREIERRKGEERET